MAVVGRGKGKKGGGEKGCQLGPAGLAQVLGTGAKATHYPRAPPASEVPLP